MLALRMEIELDIHDFREANERFSKTQNWVTHWTRAMREYDIPGRVMQEFLRVVDRTPVALEWVTILGACCLLTSGRRKTWDTSSGWAGGATWSVMFNNAEDISFETVTLQDPDRQVTLVIKGHFHGWAPQPKPVEEATKAQEGVRRMRVRRRNAL